MTASNDDQDPASDSLKKKMAMSLLNVETLPVNRNIENRK